MSTAVTRELIAERIARLQSELDEVKEAFERLGDNGEPRRALTMADLYGIWSDLSDLTLEEIKDFEYKSKLDKDVVSDLRS